MRTGQKLTLDEHKDQLCYYAERFLMGVKTESSQKGVSGIESVDNLKKR